VFTAEDFRKVVTLYGDTARNAAKATVLVASTREGLLHNSELGLTRSANAAAVIAELDPIIQRHTALLHGALTRLEMAHMELAERVSAMAATHASYNMTC